MLIVMAMISGVAMADEVTFTFKTDQDIKYIETGVSGGGSKAAISKSNVTLESSNAYVDFSKSLTVYAKSSLTVSATGNITKIELEYNGKVYPFSEAVGDGKDGEKFAESGAHPATYDVPTPANTVVLTNPNGGKVELISLKVTYTAGSTVAVTGVSLSQTSATMVVSDGLNLTATIAPNNATNKLISWASNNEEVATVKGGFVKAWKPGEATITVTSADGNYTATCKVTVEAKKAPEGAVFFETFDNSIGFGGNDGTFAPTSKDEIAIAFDNEGWTIASLTADGYSEGKVLAGDQCASIRKVNDNSQSGLYTPALGVRGNGKVTFKAESWGSDSGDFYVKIKGDGTFVAGGDETGEFTEDGSRAKVTLNKAGEWGSYTLYFEGLTEKSQIEFMARTAKRAFLDEVAVFIEEAEPADDSRADFNGDGEVNVADAVALITEMIGGTADSKYDLTGDGEVNVKDAEEVINIYLKNK